MPAAGPTRTRAKQLKVRRPAAPTARQLRNALAQRQQHVSQGGAVRRAALVQKSFGPGVALTPAKGDRVLHPSAVRQLRHQIDRELQRKAIRSEIARRGESYVSQGKAVDKLATEERHAHQLAGESLRKVQAPTRGIYNPKDVKRLQSNIATTGLKTGLQTYRIDKAEREAASRAPVLWALKQVSRPLYGSAGGALALAKGKGLGTAAHEAKRGALLKTQHTYTDVLSQIGWKPHSGLGKLARGTTGFVLDVGLDPTTYVSFGTASVTEKAAIRAAERAADSAARSAAKGLVHRVESGELTKREAARIAKARGRAVGNTHLEAAVKAGKAAGPRGITVKVAGGKYVRRAIRRAGLEAKAPGNLAKDATRAQRVVHGARGVRANAAPVTRLTAAQRHAISKLAPKGRRAQDVRTVSRLMGSELHANIRPHDLSPGEQRLVKRIQREGRAEGERTARRVTSRTNALLGRLGPHEQQTVIDAIEKRKISSLGPRTHQKTGELVGEGPGKLESPLSVIPKKLGGRGVRIRPVNAARSFRTRRDPLRLVKVASKVDQNLAYLNRVGRRSGLLAGEVGPKGRTRVEAALSAKAHARPRAIQHAALRASQEEYGKARKDLSAAERAAQERAAKKAAVKRPLGGASHKPDEATVELPAGYRTARSITRSKAEKTRRAVAEDGESGPGIYTTDHGPTAAKYRAGAEDRVKGRSKSTAEHHTFETRRPLRMLDRGTEAGEKRFRELQADPKTHKRLKGKALVDRMREAGYDGVVYPGVGKNAREVVFHSPRDLKSAAAHTSEAVETAPAKAAKPKRVNKGKLPAGYKIEESGDPKAKYDLTASDGRLVSSGMTKKELTATAHGDVAERASGRVSRAETAPRVRRVEREPAPVSGGGHPPVKEARARVRETEMRMRNLTRQQRLVTRRGAETAEARAALKRIRGERLSSEARGYFPRVLQSEIPERGFLRRMVQAAEAGGGEVPGAERLGGNKPTIGAALRREFRKTRADLRAGSERERAVVEPLSGDVRESVNRYGGSLARAAAGRNVNTKLVESGEKVPGNLRFGDFQALKKDNKSVYRVRRGTLERVDDYAHARRAGQPEAEKVRLAKLAGEADRDQADLLRQARGAKGKQRTALEEAAAAKGSEARALRRRIGTGGETGDAGQYAILSDAVVKHVREYSAPPKYAVARFYDRWQNIFKGVALATPAYLVRNVVGDAFNAAVHENPFVLARNVVRGQRALNELGRYEKAARSFEHELAHGKRTLWERAVTKSRGGEKRAPMISLTKGQAAALGISKTKISAFEAALLAEKTGVIRQGRFLELMEEQSSRPRGTHWWENTVKRVEDSVRMTTFMGALHRGLGPEEAAARASHIHFDYGDLTPVEKGLMRRLMPFYTFSSRNIPLQAKGILMHPGKYAAVQHARDEGRKQAGLPIGYEDKENRFEQRQGGIPLKVGTNADGSPHIVTLSIGSPFVDLNDAYAGLATDSGVPSPVKAAGALGQRFAELASPILKTPVELNVGKEGYSFFYRDAIKHPSEPLTRAPKWATELAHAPGPIGARFRKATGYKPNYVPPQGGSVPGWDRKADYLLRQLGPGPIYPVLDLLGQGIPGKSGKGGQTSANARGMSKAQRLLAATGLRSIEYDRNQGRVNQIYDKLDDVVDQLEVIRRLSHPTARTPGGTPFRINADHPTPEFTRLSKRESKLRKELQRRLIKTRPGGFVGGEYQPKGGASSDGGGRGAGGARGGSSSRGGGSTSRGSFAPRG